MTENECISTSIKPIPLPRKLLNIPITDMPNNRPIPTQRKIFRSPSSDSPESFVRLRTEYPSEGTLTPRFAMVIDQTNRVSRTLSMVNRPSFQEESHISPPPQPPKREDSLIYARIERIKKISMEKDTIEEENRQLSPEVDSIRLHVEDITQEEPHNQIDHPDQIKEEVSTSFLANDMDRTFTSDWSVPKEYSSSPIIKELNESVDHRPRPPSGYFAPSSSISSLNSAYQPYSVVDKLPTLLEQIVRTHHVWYLMHVGRPTATHLLRRMEPGNFIVRSSSRPNSMALSLKLPDGFDTDTDHYIIKNDERGRMVRLESSQFSFRSLPLLLEHYCIHGEELQVRLRLPTPILSCRSTKALQSIDLMGQDFWTSEMSVSRSGSRASRATVESTSFMGSQSTLASINSHNVGPYAINDTIEKTTLKKKRSSNSRADGARFATIHGDLLALSSISGNNIAPQDKETHSPPTKHDRQEDTPHTRLSRTERRSQSVRTTTGKNASTSAAPVSSSSRKSFLKNWLFGNEAKQSTQKVPSSPSKSNNTNQLASCQQFVPFPEERVKSIRSALEISSATPSSPRFDDFLRLRNSGSHCQSQVMSTFKPATASYDEVLATARVRPLPMRRERSDLCASSTSAIRLAKHTERSPGPDGKTPIRPTQSAIEQLAARNCIDELRRKRLQSTNEMLNPKQAESASATASPQLGNSDYVSMRHRDQSWRNPSERRDHRMSVPNLAAEMSSGLVAQTAKALKEKLGRTNDGELTTINEGLITPVIRRKQFLHSSVSSQSSGSSTELPSGTVARGRQTLEALIDEQHNYARKMDSNTMFGRRYNSERSRVLNNNNVKEKESELVWRRVKLLENTNNVPQEKEAINTSTLRNKKSPGDRAGCSWSAVNNELKNRQRIAKVRPTTHRRVSPQRMTVAGTEGKTSEYAQLSDFGTLDLPKHDNNNSRIRDDDDVSVAGTVFNEPWDSNVWENLLDLAHHGDDGRKLPEPIREEDSDSDRTASTTKMHDSEEEEEEWTYGTGKRTLPSDRIVNKGWEKENNDTNSRYGTIDSRLDGSISGSLRRNHPSSVSGTIQASLPNSMLSLPRAVSRFSQHMMGSIDDLPCISPLLNGSNGSEERKTSAADREQAIQFCVERMASDERCVLGGTLKQFIECTKESGELDPGIVVRRVRQFINGIKNYLVKHGEGNLHEVINEQSSLLNANQILNVDAILEVILHKLVLGKIQPHLYHLMVNEHSRSGAIPALTANLAYVRGLSFAELGLPNHEQLVTPSSSTMEQIKVCLRKMQHHYSPLKKLENLLRAVELILNSQRKVLNEESADSMTKLPSVEDLSRWLVYVLAKTSTVGCEVEAWYMWELLPQQCLAQGDTFCHLTALFQAVSILKSIDAIKRLSDRNHTLSNMDISRNFCSSPTMDSYMRIAIPDEAEGSISYATFAGVPQMTTAKLCKMIAHQHGITNPEDYGLFLILDGYETCLLQSECPESVLDQMRNSGKSFILAYKRHDAKIAWPRHAINGSI